MPVDLFFRRFGEGGRETPPLIILHGLLGSSRNWTTAGSAFGADRRVFALDLRNHGQSPHADDHSYSLMVGDVLAWMDARGMGKVDLLGHSMGGKTAMRFAVDHPERVTRLVVVDIAPRDNPPYNQRAFSALNALPLSRVRTRKDAETFLEERIPIWAFRQFLLTNLVLGAGGSFEWQVNLPVLTQSLRDLGKSPLDVGETWGGPSLFVRGGKSDFVRDRDAGLINAHFPSAGIETIAESGHNPHIESPKAFCGMVTDFLASSR